MNHIPQMPQPELLKGMTIRKLTDGYENTVDAKPGESGPGEVTSRPFEKDGPKLIIRPPFQRNFVYKEDAQVKVLDTVSKNFPLNVMYWGINADGDYEIIDGQQRTLSICRFVHDPDFYSSGLFGNDSPRRFKSLDKREQKTILDYDKLMVFVCKGDDDERLDWFRTINIASESLSEQELLNAIKGGPWTTDAKEKFGGRKTIGYKLGSRFVKGDVNRQAYVATAIKWAAIAGGDKYAGKKMMEKYMEAHRDLDNADELLAYFRVVIKWVQATFPKYREEMKGVDWGWLYHEYGEKFGAADADALEAKVKTEMGDEDVTSNAGVYAYVLTGQAKYLQTRLFNERLKSVMFERQGGKCPGYPTLADCQNKGKRFKSWRDMRGDHIKPHTKGGKTNLANCQMLCKECNSTKSDK